MRIVKSPYPDVEIRDMSITERVFEGLGDNPDRVILVEGPSGREVTVGQFTQGVKALAGGLTERGFGKGKVVALMAPNLPEYCIIFHGVAWAGGTITTINPTYTAHEVRHQLNDSGASLLITVGPFLDTAREAAEGTGVTEIAVIGEAEGATSLTDLMGSPLQAQVPVNYAEDVVVLPYSSGTTGLPKGVMLTHRNLVANVDQVLSATDVRDDEMTVAFLPFFHIYGMQVLMNIYLAGGGGLVTMPRFDLEQFLELSAKYRTPRMYIVPPIAIALAKHPIVDNYDLSCVIQVNSGAAPLGGDVADAVGARLGTLATQGYGMTELSPVSHMTPLDANRKGASGVTIANTESRIVNPETGEDAGPGETGELWVRGPQVMKGYLNNPQATAETIDAEGWLHTGDIGYIDEDGYLFVTDRVKELIKYKGFQVAPAELEAELLTSPMIADVAVIGIPDDEAGEIPMAFIVPAGDAQVTLEDVQAYLDGRLSHYKQVRRIEVVDEIPKSASGKILRRVLRDRMAAEAA
ncbi:AMP-binding protein [Jhaorihella thermophila]|uniref:4-coumarate--CoA ligase n=1 Tax=Jhaorihella thermophila TaxID=488547 RepID=A0A1H5XIK6_9RHOB|nr:AMP-binding protein [Jhaorihella thermophila]SEG11552.1 4-coumarate--CoA ligase [Jhaorihella thermophila]